MKQSSIDISSHYPENVSQYLDQSWDYDITVCGGARENCPAFVGEVVKKLHIGFDDPDAFTGREEQILEEFRRVRDEGVCSQAIELFVEGDEILDVAFHGGCNGNLKGIVALCKGQKIVDVKERLAGNDVRLTRQ